MRAVTATADVNNGQFPDTGGTGDCAGAGASGSRPWDLVRRYRRWVLKALTKTVVETALEEELPDHLGYDKYDPAERNGANSRNGTRTKTVLTDTVGEIEIQVPRPRRHFRTADGRCAGNPLSMLSQ